MTDGAKSILSVSKVDAFYGRIQALHGVSLEVRAGEVVALIGSNGAGKTTTLRTISGLMHARSGSVVFEGEDVTQLEPDTIVKRGIGHCPEGRRLFARMSVLDNLEMGAYARSDRAGIRKDLDRVFELFPRLKERSGQLAGTLSGGEQQMCAIGRAMMGKPRLLMLDEPSLGLAPIMVDTIFAVVTEIRKQGVPILLVEQNALRALEIADRAYVLETGNVVQTGPGSHLLQSEDVRKAYLGM